MIRHRPAWSRSRCYDSVSPRRHSGSTSRLRGKKKNSHKKRKHSSISSSSSCRSSSSSSSESERERKRHKSKKKKKKHSKSHSTKPDKSKKKHKRKRSPSPSLLSSSVSSDSSSSPRRSSARKKSRLASRSSSPAGVNPQSAASPVSHRDHLSLYADSNDELYSHSEDAQDSAPDNTNPVPKNQSEISQEDIGFSGLSDEVFKLLPSDMFPRKTEEFLGENRPRSSIELEVGKATKKNCSFALIKVTFDAGSTVS